MLGGDLGTHVHILWGFSKDFGISGYRCGVLYTQNEVCCKCLSFHLKHTCDPFTRVCEQVLQEALGSLSCFSAVANPIQVTSSCAQGPELPPSVDLAEICVYRRPWDRLWRMKPS